MEKSNNGMLTQATGNGEPQGVLSATPVFGRSDFVCSLELEKANLPENPTAADSVYEIVKSELIIDSKPDMNLATFCNESYTDPWGAKTVEDSIKKNFIDGHEYAGTATAALRCMHIIGKELGTNFDHPDDVHTDAGKYMYGTPTIGSSEAIMLALIAHKFMWNQSHRVLLDNYDSIGIKVDPRDQPVILMSSHVHGCWDKYCRYYGAVPLYVPILGAPYAINNTDFISGILNTKIDDQHSEYKQYAAKIRSTMGYVESQGDRTIGSLVMCVGAVVGSTFTGSQDDVKIIDDAVDIYCKEQNQQYSFEQKLKFHQAFEKWYRFQHEGQIPNRIPGLVDIPVHVDAACGFVFMFASNGSQVKFNFKDCPKRVASINLSNHKYGMTFTGMGCVLFKDKHVVDRSLVYNITYLGGNFSDYTVNFSRSSAMIIMQYYNFLRFGRSGYRAILDNCIDNAKWLIDELASNTKLNRYFKNISNNHRADGKQAIHMPVVVLTWADAVADKQIGWDLSDFSFRLDRFGWSVPSYHLPTYIHEDTDGVEVLRIVVQQVITRSRLQNLVRNMETLIDELEAKAKKQQSKTCVVES